MWQTRRRGGAYARTHYKTGEEEEEERGEEEGGEEEEEGGEEEQQEEEAVLVHGHTTGQVRHGRRRRVCTGTLCDRGGI